MGTVSEDGLMVPVGNDGLYAILCYNVDNLPESKVVEDFSKFGRVVNFRKLETGTCFIRYKEHSEALNCLTEMSKHPGYRAKIPENKGSNRNPKSYQNRNDGYEQNQRRSYNFQQNRYDESGKENNLHESYNQLAHDSKSYNSYGEPPKLMDINRTASSNLHKPSDVPPPLTKYVNVACVKELSQLPKVPATEVIVANLPPGIYQSEVFVLCAEVQPLKIDVRTTNEPYKTCYARVYVKTLKHAQTLVSTLNGHFLDNHQMIVALADTILKESGACD